MQLHRMLAFVVLFSCLAAAGVHRAFGDLPQPFPVDVNRARDVSAADRASRLRGLTPCGEGSGFQLEAGTVERARSKLRAAGEGDPDVVAVVEPAFADLLIISLSGHEVRTYRVKAVPDDERLLVDRLAGDLAPIGRRSLEPALAYEARASLARATMSAMTARRIDTLDGTMYFFGAGDDCAFTHSPRGDGDAHFAVAVVEALASDAPEADVARLVTALSESSASR